MIIEITKDGGNYVVHVPNANKTSAWSVRFPDLKGAHDLADACVEWFSDCKIVFRSEPEQLDIAC